jgi:hypothetical protein
MKLTPNWLQAHQPRTVGEQYLFREIIENGQSKELWVFDYSLF